MGTSLSEKYIFYGKDRTVTRGVFSTWSLIPGMGPRGQCCGANLTPWPSQIYERLSCSPWLRNLKAMALEKWKQRVWADASMDYLDCRSTLEKERSKSSFQGMGTLAHSGFPLIVAKTTLFIIGPFYVISMSFVNYFFSWSVDTN